MGTHNPNGRGNGHDPHGDDQFGQGQSGYGAGRLGDDRAMMEQHRNRNQVQRPGRFEEPEQGFGTDERFTGGRGGDEHWTDRSELAWRERTGFQGDFGGRPQQQRGPHRGKGPTSYTRSDEKIREQICEALTDDEHIDASHIEVVVKDGEVVLSGTVEDRRAKRLAEDIADRCAGVKDIQNQLKLQGDSQTRSTKNRV